MIYGPPRDTCTTCGDCTKTPSGLCQHGTKSKSCTETCEDVLYLRRVGGELDYKLTASERENERLRARVAELETQAGWRQMEIEGLRIVMDGARDGFAKARAEERDRIVGLVVAEKKGLGLIEDEWDRGYAAACDDVIQVIRSRQ